LNSYALKGLHKVRRRDKFERGAQIDRVLRSECDLETALSAFPQRDHLGELGPPCFSEHRQAGTLVVLIDHNFDQTVPLQWRGLYCESRRSGTDRPTSHIRVYSRPFAVVLTIMWHSRPFAVYVANLGDPGRTALPPHIRVYSRPFAVVSNQPPCGIRVHSRSFLTSPHVAFASIRG
jgi:hypothetical protein